MAINNPDTVLVAIAKLKAEYKTISDEGKDGKIKQAIAGASGLISNWCGRRFTLATHTDEKHSGDGSTRLYLRHWPITAITTIHNDLNRKWASSTLLTEDTDSVTGHYQYDDTEDGMGCVEAVNGRSWTEGVRNIKVTYEAGYNFIPDAIEQAAFKLAARWFEIADGSKDAVTSVSYPLGGGSVSVTLHEIPDDVVELLSPFRRRLY